LHPLPPGSIFDVASSVGRVSKDWQGNLRPFIYDDSQMVLAIPIWHRIAAGQILEGSLKILKNATHMSIMSPGKRQETENMGG
jgi:hypothetical protein